MNLPDAPIAREGFFAAHFFTVRDQEKSRDFYVRILGGKLIKAENPCYIKLANTWIISRWLFGLPYSINFLNR
jgi:glyoxalase/bleomycin resistance protein/dioxygenase superfamily protein